MHLAVAVGAPTVGLFGATHPDACGPYGLPHEAVLKRRISMKGDLQPLIERMKYKGIADRVFAKLQTQFIDEP